MGYDVTGFQEEEDEVLIALFEEESWRSQYRHLTVSNAWIT